MNKNNFFSNSFYSLLNISKKNCIIFLLLTLFFISCSSNIPSSGIDDFYNFPNPFNSKESYTTYKVSIKSGEIISAKIEIYSNSGDLLDSKDLTVNTSDKKIATCIWSGFDKNGKYLPAGVYKAKITVRDNQDAIFINELKTYII